MRIQHKIKLILLSILITILGITLNLDVALCQKPKKSLFELDSSDRVEFDMITVGIVRFWADDLERITFISESERNKYDSLDQVQQLGKILWSPIFINDTIHAMIKKKIDNLKIPLFSDIPSDTIRNTVLFSIVFQDVNKKWIEYGIDLKYGSNLIKSIFKSTLRKEDYEKIIDFINKYKIYILDY